MSPAARRLLTNKLGVRHGTDKALQASYTPSPSVRHGSVTPGAITPNIVSHSPTGGSITPKIQTQKRVTGSGIVEGELSFGLTDNLLDLPKRPKNISPQESDNAQNSRKCAADFF